MTVNIARLRRSRGPCVLTNAKIGVPPWLQSQEERRFDRIHHEASTTCSAFPDLGVNHLHLGDRAKLNTVGAAPRTKFGDALSRQQKQLVAIDALKLI
jgi:hypothetical protein